MAERLIFFVDDEPMFINLMEYTFRGRSGYQVRSFYSGEACIAELHLNPDLVVIDYCLDSKGISMTGLDLVKHIRKSNPTATLIFLSGSDDPAVIAEAKFLGVERYIQKDGYFINNLIDCIATILPPNHSKSQLAVTNDNP